MSQELYFQSETMEIVHQPAKLAWANPFSNGVYRVWQRNRDCFFRQWKTELWPPFAEAILSLLAFGFGLGVYIQQQIEGVSYLQFISPGLVMNTVIFTASFECLFGTYFRMIIQKTFDAIIATPISPEEVVSADIVWAATRAGMTAVSVLIVLAILNLTPSYWTLLVPFVAFLSGFMLASMAIIVTSLVPSINAYNYYISLGVLPMTFFSGIFFPISRMPENIAWIIYLSPAFPAVQLTRALMLGQVGWNLFGYLIWIGVLSLIFYVTALTLMRRRLIK